MLTTLLRNGTPVTRHVDARSDAVLANLSAFAAAVEGRASYPFSDAELVHNVAVLEAVARSATSGSSVTLSRDTAWIGSPS
jgi:hypothetical protein